jgi:hypothetical protein
MGDKCNLIYLHKSQMSPFRSFCCFHWLKCMHSRDQQLLKGFCNFEDRQDALTHLHVNQYGFNRADQVARRLLLLGIRPSTTSKTY